MQAIFVELHGWIDEASVRRQMKSKPETKARRKRKLFNELVEGFDALADQREGKRTLVTHRVDARPVLAVKPSDIQKLRERMNLSRALFAHYLRTNIRTLENWEQGRATPNAQAAVLLKLVERFPDTVERLGAL
jgi:putative transcriptional regulator